MNERIKGELVEIDINKKYAIIMKEELSVERYHELLNNIQKFLKSNQPFMIIDGTHVELIDLSERE